ncbi:GNAT family N-acetyltransferase [Lysobacter sp. A3-1-A15]|uniref:GNAT family N-acetyltransferase n=1 Tax=Novilysobacter viscosus TaxID=3098602 RepID=UPI002ED87981
MHIRHSGPGDIDAVRAIYAQSSNHAATLQLPYPSRALWETRLAGTDEHFHSLVACEADEVLGQIGIATHARHRRRHVANIGMAVSEQARGRGVGRALLQAAVELCEGWLAVHRIELEVYTDNAAAIALYASCGFVREGTARGYAWRDGGYVDAHLMARLSGPLGGAG